MDVRAIGERLGKQAAVSDGGRAARAALRLQRIAANPPKTQFRAAMEGLRQGAGQGVGNVVNAYTFGLSDRYGLTNTDQYVNDAANKWSKGMALTSAIAMPVGGVLKGGLAAMRAARGSKAVAAIGRVLQARKATSVARAAAPASRAGSAIGDIARFASTIPFPRPAAALSYTLRAPSFARMLAKAPLAIPGVRPGLSALARTRMLKPVARGVRAVDNAYLRLAGTRPMQALSRVGNFVEGGGGRASKAFMAADAAAGAYFGVPQVLGGTQGIRNFDPEAEAVGRALGYDSQFVADLSTTPGSFVPAARLQPPLFNTIPGMVNERRTKKWVDQYGRDVQSLTDLQTAASKDLLSRRY